MSNGKASYHKICNDLSYTFSINYYTTNRKNNKKKKPNKQINKHPNNVVFWPLIRPKMPFKGDAPEGSDSF